MTFLRCQVFRSAVRIAFAAAVNDDLPGGPVLSGIHPTRGIRNSRSWLLWRISAKLSMHPVRFLKFCGPVSVLVFVSASPVRGQSADLTPVERGLLEQWR